MCATSNKIVFVKSKKTGWEQFVAVQTNYREQDTGQGFVICYSHWEGSAAFKGQDRAAHTW